MWGLMVALLAQASGACSRIAARRAGDGDGLILGGTLGDFIFIIGIGSRQDSPD